MVKVIVVLIRKDKKHGTVEEPTPKHQNHEDAEQKDAALKNPL